ncbi:SDR family oxidoreductase [Qingshengfaniella alkalisoli]|uniref:SDR family oxidoreductase n=1 Tax=Qingshengfaniella alkalisoli TaxID=2599296 RepID=A0A5B8IQ56_9RHOB|nr:SDR family oxidoreductase [Qingshengfaniella alkalisoli]QDY68382.1 SDR family oxidoreductase [Qingshengfaniella alkalisoli]
MSTESRKTVLITGASKGIGAATAREYAARGWNVALVARSNELIADLAGEIGPQAIAIPCDVTRFWEMEAAVKAVVTSFGSLDVLINNAGVIEPIGAIADMNPDDWGKVIDINVKGVFNGARAVLPVMLAAGGGSILTVSSGAATNPLEGWSHYCSSKAAVAMFTRCLDVEYRTQGIRALGLSPGTVRTQMQDQIRESGINPVSQMDPAMHVPPEWPAKALFWLSGSDSDDLIGTEVALRDNSIRRRVGLIE